MRGEAGSGASGSCTTRARLFAPWGTPVNSSAGETSSPSQVWRRGILPPCANAGERMVSMRALCSAPRRRQGPAWYRSGVEKPRVFITRRLALAPGSVLGTGIEIDQYDSELALPRDELLRRVHHASGLLPILGDRVDNELLDSPPPLRNDADHSGGAHHVGLPA